MKDQARTAQRDTMIGPVLEIMRFDILSLSGHALQCGTKIFMNWNMPYVDLHLPKGLLHDPFSPFGSATTPASDVIVATPSSAHMVSSPQNLTSPRIATSPNNAPSPTAVALLDSVKIERALLFVQGRHVELLKGMSHQGKEVMTNWIHQFWLFSFKTAKHWGRGPRNWTAPMLGFEDFHEPRDRSQGQLCFNRNKPGESSNQWHTRHNADDNFLQSPTSLCRWSIHVRDINYEAVSSPARVESYNVNYEDEESWSAWRELDSSEHCAQVLKTGMESNSFSSIRAGDLPISATQISKATERSPEELLQETFGFAIMSHNFELVWDFLYKQFLDKKSLARSGLFPFHLAISYLDGSKTCCNLFNHLVGGMSTGDASLRKLYINHLGHTVLDNMMMAILKSHSACLPGVVDDSFKKELRFAGEEVDICGRWDADSNCIQGLNLTQGNSPIPFEWKHVFCHTSVQVICHCIGALFGPYWAPDINTPSGLFTKRCPNEECGQKLQLLPLHTLVVTTVNLAIHGSSGETLFGMVACLLSLLSYGANPLLKAHVSLKVLFSNESDDNECSHRELDPLELVEELPQDIVSRWSRDAQMSWGLFSRILTLSHRQWRPKEKQRADSFEISQFFEDSNSDSIDTIDINQSEVENTEMDDVQSEYHSEQGDRLPIQCTICPSKKNFFGDSQQLSILWSTVQTEYTTYRRIEEGDAWISPNFDIHSILSAIDFGEDLESCIGLIKNGMMSEDYCDCGRFYNANDEVCVGPEEVSAHHFSNLEDWKRNNFIDIPLSCEENWYWKPENFA